ncbi:MAG: HAMP domain-containing histidine kinase [Candidatus Sericytochromatia bacterium]|nr:HAMP domain-containing histidine kinase [Candidatus Tanganyikabacteria bacterium]
MGDCLEALRQIDLLKDQFLSILMHELRTPLNYVTGFGSLLQDEASGSLNPVQQGHLERILAGAEALERLVDDLLDMGQIQAGRFKVHPEPGSVAEVVLDVVTGLAPVADARGIELVNRVGADSPDAHFDRVRVGQVLGNLVGNALKFTPEGGHVEIRAREEGDFLLCEVFDDGPAIPPEARDKVFDRFAQLDRASTRRVSGVGLGLAICKAIVEAHGGRIGVAGDNEAGTTLWFTLPLAAPAVAKASPGSGRPAASCPRG